MTTPNQSAPIPKPLPPSANLSDALGQLGLKFQTMHARIRPVFQPIHLGGWAYTVQCYAGATFALEEALEHAAAGDVLVVQGENYAGAVLMGELMSARARKRGLAGAVIDGAVRDTATLRKVRWPVFAAAVTPRAGTFDRQGARQSVIACGEVVVQPGDLIRGDDDGVVVITRPRVAEVLALARQIEKKERFLAALLAKGLRLDEAVARYRQRHADNSGRPKK